MAATHYETSDISLNDIDFALSDDNVEFHCVKLIGSASILCDFSNQHVSGNEQIAIQPWRLWRLFGR